MSCHLWVFLSSTSHSLHMMLDNFVDGFFALSSNLKIFPW